MKKNKGNALNQYGIIIGIISAVLVPTLFIFGNNLQSAFNSYSKTFASNPKIQAPKMLTPEVSYDFTRVASPSNPVKNCLDGKCSIDFGDFQLSGIPENFNDLVETSGASGGTKLNADLLMQIATQLEKEGLTHQAEIIKKLSVTGHNIASIEAEIENVYALCNNEESCIASKTGQIMSTPSNFDNTYNEYIPASYADTILYAVVSDLTQKDNPVRYDNAVSKNGNGLLLKKYLNELYAQEDVSQTTKDVVKELVWDIAVMAEDVQSIFNATVEPLSLARSDFFTGENRGLYPTTSDIVADFLDYSASDITNFDSALICAAGKYQDTGKKCH